MEVVQHFNVGEVREAHQGFRLKAGCPLDGGSFIIPTIIHGGGASGRHIPDGLNSNVHGNPRGPYCHT